MDNSAAWIPKAGSKVNISLEFTKALRQYPWDEEELRSGAWIDIMTKAAEQGTLVDVVFVHPHIYRPMHYGYYKPDPFLCIMFGAPICCEIMFHRDTGAFWMFDKDSASVFLTDESYGSQQASALEIFKITVRVGNNFSDDLFFMNLPTKVEVVSALVSNRDNKGLNYKQNYRQYYKKAIEAIALSKEWLVVDSGRHFIRMYSTSDPLLYWDNEVCISAEKIKVVSNQGVISDG